MNLFNRLSVRRFVHRCSERNSECLSKMSCSDGCRWPWQGRGVVPETLLFLTSHLTTTPSHGANAKQRPFAKTKGLEECPGGRSEDCKTSNCGEGGESPGSCGNIKHVDYYLWTADSWGRLRGVWVMRCRGELWAPPPPLFYICTSLDTSSFFSPHKFFFF